MSDLEPRELVLPATGELIDLTDPPQVAYALEQVRTLKAALDNVRALLEELLREESLKYGGKTFRLGEYECVVSGGSKPTVDVEKLVIGLLEAGLPEARMQQAVQQIVSYKVNYAVLDQIAKANPAYKEIIDAHTGREPAAWRVSVKKGK